MRHYTDIADFADGVRKLADRNREPEQMPVLLSVDGKIAPFGICLEENVNGVPCLVFTGHSEVMRNVTVETWKDQIRQSHEENRSGNR